MTKPQLLTLDRIGTPNLGYISILEKGSENLPFEIKRVYWTYFTPNHVERGNHAHKKLQQIIVAVSGVIDFNLIDTKKNEFKFVLDSPEKALFIPEGYWREIRFSHNAVLLCLASEEYDETDYIRDYDEFLELSNHG